MNAFHKNNLILFSIGFVLENTIMVEPKVMLLQLMTSLDNAVNGG